LTLFLATGCNLNKSKVSESQTALEGSWQVISVVEPDCKRCSEHWPRRKFLSHQLNKGDFFDFSKEELTYRPTAGKSVHKFNYRFNDGSFELLGGDWVWQINLKQVASDTLLITLGQSVLPDTGSTLEPRDMYVTLLRQ
jgi:hypothetical protein